jgi:hypothetical protein
LQAAEHKILKKPPEPNTVTSNWRSQLKNLATPEDYGNSTTIDKNTKVRPVPVKLYAGILLTIWTLVVMARGGWNLLQQKQEATDIARHIALTNYERDVLYRHCAAGTKPRHPLGPSANLNQPGLYDPPGVCFGPKIRSAPGASHQFEAHPPRTKIKQPWEPVSLPQFRWPAGAPGPDHNSSASAARYPRCCQRPFQNESPFPA